MRVASLHTYPIKSCHGSTHDGVRVEPWGVSGDRRWMVVDPDGEAVTQREAPALATVRPAARPDPAPGLLVRCGDRPELIVPEPEGGESIPVSVFGAPVRAVYAGDRARDWFSELLDRDARLVWLSDPTQRPVYPERVSPERVALADAFPLSLTNTASLDQVNGWLAAQDGEVAPVPMARFRPNVVITGARAWQEDDWTGRRLRIGSVTFRVPEPIPRCVIITTDQDTGQRGKEPLHVLAQHRNTDQKVLFATALVPDGPGEVAVGDPVVEL